jgi:hypothetical protein
VTAQLPQAIKAAVQECLDRCYRGTTPLGEIAQFADELRAQAWDEPDIVNVEVAVRRVLAGVMGGPASDDNVG